jgi:hypothetical protein
VNIALAFGIATVLLLAFSGGDPPPGRDYVLAAFGFASAVALVFTEIALTLEHMTAISSGAQKDIEDTMLALATGISTAINELGTDLRNFGPGGFPSSGSGPATPVMVTPMSAPRRCEQQTADLEDPT